MTSWRIIEGDCVAAMAAMGECSVDAVVTDPPYGLEFMGKEWDKLGAATEEVTGQRVRYGRSAKSMQAWHEAWATEALRVLRPGGYLLAFGGTRTYHRLASGIEDAGFEIRDCVAWLYGSGFPKHKSALKPAHEPVVLARKSAGASTPLNIDACRIPTDDAWTFGPRAQGERSSGIKGVPAEREPSESNPLGRWPANVVLDEVAAAMLDEQTEDRLHGAGHARSGSGDPQPSVKQWDWQGPGANDTGEMHRFGDSGGASRFMYVAKPDQGERNVGLDARNPHPTVKPVELMRWLVRLITPEGGTVLDPFAGSGTTGIAALREGRSFIGIDREAEYVQVARARIIGDAPLLNTVGEAA